MPQIGGQAVAEGPSKAEFLANTAAREAQALQQALGAAREDSVKQAAHSAEQEQHRVRLEREHAKTVQEAAVKQSSAPPVDLQAEAESILTAKDKRDHEIANRLAARNKELAESHQRSEQAGIESRMTNQKMMEEQAVEQKVMLQQAVKASARADKEAWYHSEAVQRMRRIKDEPIPNITAMESGTKRPAEDVELKRERIAAKEQAVGPAVKFEEGEPAAVRVKKERLAAKLGVAPPAQPALQGVQVGGGKPFKLIADAPPQVPALDTTAVRAGLKKKEEQLQKDLAESNLRGAALVKEKLRRKELELQKGLAESNIRGGKMLQEIEAMKRERGKREQQMAVEQTRKWQEKQQEAALFKGGQLKRPDKAQLDVIAQMATAHRARMAQVAAARATPAATTALKLQGSRQLRAAGLQKNAFPTLHRVLEQFQSLVPVPVQAAPPMIAPAGGSPPPPGPPDPPGGPGGGGGGAGGGGGRAPRQLRHTGPPLTRVQGPGAVVDPMVVADPMVPTTAPAAPAVPAPRLGVEQGPGVLIPTTAPAIPAPRLGVEQGPGVTVPPVHLSFTDPQQDPQQDPVKLSFTQDPVKLSFTGQEQFGEDIKFGAQERRREGRRVRFEEEEKRPELVPPDYRRPRPPGGPGGGPDGDPARRPRPPGPPDGGAGGGGPGKRGRGGWGGGPIIVTGAAGAAAGGAGGASSSAASSGAAGAAGAAGRKEEPKKKSRKAQSGITKAKKRYTDKRKVKLAELRSLKSKRIREFAAKTKGMPKAQRDKARKAFKANANAQYSEVAKRFPTARGLRDAATVRELIAKLEKTRMAK